MICKKVVGTLIKYVKRYLFLPIEYLNNFQKSPLKCCSWTWILISFFFRKTKKCHSTQPIHHLFRTFIYWSTRIGSMLISRGELATTFLLEKKRKVLGDILNMDMLTRLAQLLKNNHNNNKLYIILFSCILWFKF